MNPDYFQSITASRVEYLAIFESDNASCKSEIGIRNLILTIDQTKLEGEAIHYKSIRASLQIQNESSHNDSHRCFHLLFNIVREGDARPHLELQTIEDYETFLRNVRSVLTNASQETIDIIWDDISFQYAQIAFPLIQRIENILRKLIAKFMIINVGKNWIKESIPKEVKESFRGKSSNKFQQYLYELDFIQLSDLLFKEYSTISTDEIIKVLSSPEIGPEDKLEKLIPFVPKSNWDRYFSSLVECEGAHLKKLWDQLYYLRCDIAHSRAISRQSLTNIISYCDELTPHLENAITALDSITISPNEKRQILDEYQDIHEQSESVCQDSWNKLIEILHLIISRKSNEHEIDETDIDIRSLFGQIYVQDIITSYKLLTDDEIYELAELWDKYRKSQQNKLSTSELIDLTEEILNFARQIADAELFKPKE